MYEDNQTSKYLSDTKLPKEFHIPPILSAIESSNLIKRMNETKKILDNSMATYKTVFQHVERSRVPISQSALSNLDYLKNYWDPQAVAPLQSLLHEQQRFKISFQNLNLTLAEISYTNRRMLKDFDSSLFQIADQQRSFHRFLDTTSAINLVKIQSKLQGIIESMDISMDDYETTLNQAIQPLLKNEIINSIDYSDMEIESIDSTIATERPSGELTQEMVAEIERKIQEHSKRNGKSISIGALIVFLFEDYFRELGILVLHTFITLLISIGTSTIPAPSEVVKQIQNKVQETSTYRDIKNYYKEVNPYYIDYQIAVLRAPSLLRHGASKTSPVLNNVGVSKNTVLHILKRKGGWIKVQIENETDCIIGWVQESKITKLK